MLLDGLLLDGHALGVLLATRNRRHPRSLDCRLLGLAAAGVLFLRDLEEVVAHPLAVAHQVAPARVLARARRREAGGSMCD